MHCSFVCGNAFALDIQGSKPKECYEKLINTNAVLKWSVIIWSLVHPYTIYFLKNRAFYMTYLKAVIELGMEQSDERCLGIL